jgi:hypothetical protein
MLAGYIPAWMLFPDGVNWIANVVGCDRNAAREALLAALYDGAVKSRFAVNGEPIEAYRWCPPVVFVEGNDTPLIGDSQLIELHRADVQRRWAVPTTQGVGPKGGEQKIDRLAWGIAEDILKSPDAPRRGHGRQMALARLVNAELARRGHKRQDDSIRKAIGLGLRKWEAENPEK